MRNLIRIVEHEQVRGRSHLSEAGGELQPIEATVFHGSPHTGIKAFDPAKRGSNTGDRDAKQGFFFFGTSRSAEGYLEHDEDLKPAVRAKVDEIQSRQRQHRAAFEARAREKLAAAGIDPGTVNLGDPVWALRLPPGVRDDFRGLERSDDDALMADYLGRQAWAIEDRSENLVQLMNGAVYQCRIRLSHAHVQDMQGAAYTAEGYAKIINFARNNWQPDGIVLHNVLDSEVGRRDTVYIVFDAHNIEIVDQKIYDNVETAYRRY